MKKRYSRAASALLLLIVSLTSAFPTTTSLANTQNTVSTAAPTAFASPLFQSLWERTDGLVASGQASRSWLWGPEPGVKLTENVNSQSFDVQYFDKARMELNPAVTDPSSQWRVTTGLLVSELAGISGPAIGKPAAIVVAGDSSPSNPQYSDFSPSLLKRAADATGSTAFLALTSKGKPQSALPTNVRYAQYIEATSHNIPDVFWTYLNSSGPVKQADGTVATTQVFDWLYVMGYPITEPYWSSLIIDGKPQLALVQLYQRRVLTYVPSFPKEWQVQMGNVGAAYYNWRYANPSTTPEPGKPAPIPPLKSPGGGFVSLSGDHFAYRGSNVLLKGTNYWLSAAPFADTWAEWNGPRVLAELDHARDLGINTIRIGIPYDTQQTFDVIWGDDQTMTVVGPWIKSQLTQLLQVASLYGMKVIFVLFDFYDDHPPANTKQEQSNFAYIDGLVGAFANDDRVLAWDISNEPDNTPEWKDGRQSDYIDWLRRMAIHLRSVDAKHPITVGVGDYRTLWYKSDTGDTILDISDFVQFHCYDAGNLTNQINEIKARTKKPIFLGEMGWPTSNGERAPRPGTTFDEPTQNYLYTTMLDQAKASNIAGLAQWTLYDFSDEKAHLVGGFERYFGLLRLDSTPKPSYSIFKENYTAPQLPSDTKTNIPLDTSDKPQTR